MAGYTTYHTSDQRGNNWKLEVTEKSVSSNEQEYGVVLKTTDKITTYNTEKCHFEIDFDITKRQTDAKMNGLLRPLKFKITPDINTAAYYVTIELIKTDSTDDDRLQFYKKSTMLRPVDYMNKYIELTTWNCAYEYKNNTIPRYFQITLLKAGMNSGRSYIIRLDNSSFKLLNIDENQPTNPYINIGIDDVYNTIKNRGFVTPSDIIKLGYSANSKNNICNSASCIRLVFSKNKETEIIVWKYIDDNKGETNIGLDSAEFLYKLYENDIEITDLHLNNLTIEGIRYDKYSRSIYSVDTINLGTFYVLPDKMDPVIKISFTGAAEFSDMTDYCSLEYPHDTCLLLTEKLETNNKLCVSIYNNGIAGAWSGNEVYIKADDNIVDEFIPRKPGVPLLEGQIERYTFGTLTDLEVTFDGTTTYEIIVIPFVDIGGTRIYLTKNNCDYSTLFDSDKRCKIINKYEEVYGFHTKKFKLLNYPKYSFSGLDTSQKSEYKKKRKFIKTDTINNKFNCYLEDSTIAASLNANKPVTAIGYGYGTIMKDENYSYNTSLVIIVTDNKGNIITKTVGNSKDYDFVIIKEFTEIVTRYTITPLDYIKLRDIINHFNISKDKISNYKFYLFNMTTCTDKNNPFATKTNYFQYIARLYYFPELFIPDSNFEARTNITSSAIDLSYDITTHYLNNQNGIIDAAKFKIQKGTSSTTSAYITRNSEILAYTFVGTEPSWYDCYAKLFYKENNEYFENTSADILSSVQVWKNTSATKPIIIAPVQEETDISFMSVNKVYFLLIIQLPQVPSGRGNFSKYNSITVTANNLSGTTKSHVYTQQSSNVKSAWNQGGIAIIKIDSSSEFTSLDTVADYHNMINYDITVSVNITTTTSTFDSERSDIKAVNGIKLSSLSYDSFISINNYKRLHDIASAYCKAYTTNSNSLRIINYAKSRGDIINIQDFREIKNCLEIAIDSLNDIIGRIETITLPDIPDDTEGKFISKKPTNTNQYYNALKQLYDILKAIYHQS